MLYLSDDMTPEELRDAAAEERRNRKLVLPTLAEVLAVAIREINYERRLREFFGE